MKRILITILVVLTAIILTFCNKNEDPAKRTPTATISYQYNVETNAYTLILKFKPAIRQAAVAKLSIRCEEGIKTNLPNTIDIPAWANNISINIPIEWTGQPEKDEGTIKIKIIEVTGDNVYCEIGEPSEIVLNVKKK